MTLPPFNAPLLETMNRLLPAFEFKSIIASHALGAVYLANQKSLDRSVAIKILSPQISGEPKFRQSFETTARTMAKLNHPNLIGVYDSGFVDGMLYFVMEFVPGKSLERSSQGHRIESSQALLLIEGICAGLAHAHTHGIIHGDLHPASILLNQKAEPKLGNFGFTHPHDTPHGSEAAAADSSFVAPEVLRDSDAVDPRSDIFSVGAILYTLLTGQAHQADAPPPSAVVKCDPRLDKICQQATDPDPAKRFKDIPALQAALTDLGKTARGPRTLTPQGAQATASAGKQITGPIAPASKKLGVAGPSPGGNPPPAGPPPKVSVGTNWKLIRNLIIIAGLLYAISIAWEWRKKKVAERERENRETVEKAAIDREKALAAARARKLNDTRPSTPPPVDPVIPTPPPETPAESLARLRNALASGHRVEMPAGSVKKGDNQYLFIAELMSWPDAAWYAEQHGGYLAIPNIPADVPWLSTHVPDGEELWLGGGRNARQFWSLVDGSIWKPKKEPSGTGNYLAVNEHGLLRAVRSEERHPFLIQWHLDGSNPGTLTACLDKTRSSLGTSDRVFPPGTRVLDNRYYYIVTRPVTWRDAVDLATQGGGHLAVASEVGEIASIDAMCKSYSAPDGLWLGGFRKGEKWVWITGEPWKSANWQKDTSTEFPNAALVLQPGRNWSARDLSDTASGFIIEWSNDHKSSSAISTDTSTTPGAGSGDASALAAKARELIVALDLKRSEQLATNARSYSWDLDLFFRGLSKGAQASWAPHVQRLKSFAQSNRVPSSIPKSTGILLSEQMAKVSQYCAKKQDEIDATFLADAEKIRSAYVSKLNTLFADAQAAGQRSIADSLRESITSASNLESWIRSFGIDPKPENPIPGAIPRLPDRDQPAPTPDPEPRDQTPLIE